MITRYISHGGHGVRLDSCVSGGYVFPSQYDSAAALRIACGYSWIKIVKLMQRALREYIVGGVKTTSPFLKQIVKHPQFISGDYTTKFIQETPEFISYASGFDVRHYLGVTNDIFKIVADVAGVSMKKAT
jgi:pyruvate carboxylase